MRLNNSGYVNQRMANLKMDVVRMAHGIKPLKLGGYTLRAMKMGPTFLDNNDWRAVCIKCSGAGHLNPEEVNYEVKEIDVRGRIDVCFACDGKGWFPIPQPTTYKEFLTLWLMEKVEQGKWEEIDRVCDSEMTYITNLGREHGWESVPYEVEVGKFWRWVERRMDAVDEGAPFFTSIPNKIIDRYNQQHRKEEDTNEEVNERAQEASEHQIEEKDIDDAIQAAFAHLEALLA